jgi:hypothetical protein
LATPFYIACDVAHFKSVPSPGKTYSRWLAGVKNVKNVRFLSRTGVCKQAGPPLNILAIYLDQAGLRIAAVGPAVSAVGPSVGPAFLARSEMSGHVRTCRTFLEMSDIFGNVRHFRTSRTSSVGPALSNGFEELFRVGQIAF